MGEKLLYLLDLERYASDRSEFLKYYVHDSLRMIRRGIILTTTLYSIFAVLDLYAAPETYHQIWVIRFVYIVLALILIYWSSFSSFFVRFSQPIMAVLFCLISTGII